MHHLTIIAAYHTSQHGPQYSQHSEAHLNFLTPIVSAFSVMALNDLHPSTAGTIIHGRLNPK
jgi:hypothetical protein